MAGWTSLAGYLTYRPGGALGRLKTRKRQWYVFEESKCQLLCYKSENEYATAKPPVGAIDIRGAAISLSLDDGNQFIIHSNKKDHILTADNHESLMIWLVALQAKRDAFNNRLTPIVEQDNRYDSDRKRTESLPSDHEIQEMISKAIRAEVSPLVRTQSLCISPRPYDPNKRRLFRSSHFDFSDVTGTSSDTSGEGPHSCPLPSSMPDPLRTLRASRGSSCSDASDTKSVISEPSDRASTCVRRWPLNEASRSLSSPASVQSLESDQGNNNRIREMEGVVIATKCELAKVLNREATLKDVLQEKDHVIAVLEDQLTHAGQAFGNLADTQDGPRAEEKCRILQNQNRFLNEEVLKLSRMWQQEQVKFLQYTQKIKDLENYIDQLRRDYLLLLQSCIRLTGSEGPEVLEVNLFGGSRHKKRVCELLEESRQVNPSLPTYEGMMKSGCHVDSHGFKHTYVNEGLTLHYLCRQLTQHYNAQLIGCEHHQVRWKEILWEYGEKLPKTKELKSLVRQGIPGHLRSRVWVLFIRSKVQDIMEAKGPHYYSNLVSMAPDSEVVSHYRRQISLDLLRTMPNNIHFNHLNADGIQKLQEVLQAFCLHNPTVGYCQGMNFLAATSLLFMEPEDAFWCLVAVTERYFMPHYFDQNLLGAQADQEVLRELLKDKLPLLYRHLMDHDIELCTVTLNWFLAIFFDCIPFETLLRIWDCFLLEGPKVLFRFSLAILKMREAAILDKSDAVSIMKQLKLASSFCYDIEGLIKVAFEELEPFPRRADIAAKQTCYFKALKETSRKRAVERVSYENKEKMLQDLKFCSGDVLTIECAAVYDKDQLWICQGHQNLGQVMRVNSTECVMYNLSNQFDSRIMCIHNMNDNLMLLGTLSHYLYAFNSKTIEELWHVYLNDTILSICSYEDDEKSRIYIALVDGTIGILEDVNLNSLTPPEVSYIQTASSPITCLRIINEQLWCAFSNKVAVINTRTGDTVDQFLISSNTMDTISNMVEDENGAWISLRGSSVIQLWDPHSFMCKMMFDVRDNKYPPLPRDEDTFSPSRVTSILPYNKSLWVGTGDGNLIIFDIQSKLSTKSNSNNTDLNEKDNENNQDSCLIMNTQGRPKQVRDRSDSGYQTVGMETATLKEAFVNHFSLDLCLPNRKNVPCANKFSYPDSETDEKEAENVSQNNKETDFLSPKVPLTRKSTSDLPQNSSSQCNGYFQDNVICAYQTSESPVRNCVKLQYKDKGDRIETVCQIHRTNKLRTEPFKQCYCTDKSIGTTLSNGNMATKLMEASSFTKRNGLQFLEERVNRTASDAVLAKSESESSPCKKAPNDYTYTLTHHGSFDNVCHLLQDGRESTVSSPTCDSYEFDDVFVVYTEEEKSKKEGKQSETGSNSALKCADELMDLFNKNDSLIKAHKLNNRTSYLDNKNSSLRSVDGSDDDVDTSLSSYSEGQPIPKGHTTTVNVNVECVDSVADSHNWHWKGKWSSLEDFSMPSNIEYDSVQDSQQQKDYLKLNMDLQSTMAKSSDSGSFVSLSSNDVPYTFELLLKEKIKIADKPIKVLATVQCDEETAIISCAGSSSDDEAVLKWTLEGEEEKLWTNDPIVEVCPLTNTVKPSKFTRSRLPRQSSIISTVTTASNSSQESETVCKESTTTSGNSVKKQLARVHSILTGISG